MRNRPTAAPTSYADRPTTKPPAWHALVAWDMLFNGLSTGLFLTAALGELAAPALLAPVADVAYPVALFVLLLDLLFLVLDLGDPWRFHHMLRVFKPTSPMSLGTWSLATYSLPLSVIVATELLPAEWTAAWVRKAAVIAGLLPALASAVYKGVLISTNAQPGWRDARWMGAYLTTSAFALGCAELLALSVLTGHDDAVPVLRPGCALLLALNAVVLALLVGNVRIVLARLYPRRKLWLVGTACVGGTVVLPLALVLLGGSAPVILGAVLSLLLGSLAARFVIVAMPHAPG